MRAPLVSVIIPTHNRSDRFLPRASRSVLNQTWQNLELIIVDDGSTDGTADVVKRLGDERVRYLVHDESRGGCAARNSGVEVAHGEFVAFLDDDDEWLPHKLERQLQVFDAHNDLGLVYGGWNWVKDGTEETQRHRVPDAKGLIDGMPRWFYNMVDDYVVRTKLVRRTGYCEGLITFHHVDILIRLAQICSFGYVPEVLALCYNHKGQRESDPAQYRAEGIEYLLKTHRSFLSSYPLARADFNLRLGTLKLIELGNPSGSRQHLLASVQAQPRRAKTWAYALASLLPSTIVHRSAAVYHALCQRLDH
ncbi:MAG: glycosyltransferase family 2 protein [Verrucomicrobia bacterium]|nr:glycosyltransferase family 2 protein [Verrucomicrobiota bacterium]